MKKVLALLLTCIFIITLGGCSQKASPAGDSSEKTLNYQFKDSCGREVEIGKNIERIAPSGPLAQIVLYTLCPEKMVGWASEFSEKQQQYIDGKYARLPVFGNFYGDTLNLESVMSAEPQIVLDIGEKKSTTKEDMDTIQEKTGIPTVFVEMEMDSMTDAYETLGKIVGEEERAQQFIAYIENMLEETQSGLQSIPENKRKTVYYGQDEGLTAIAAGTVHDEVIAYAGGVNVASAEKTSHGGISEISMEQLLLWNPEVILLAPESIYESVSQKEEWQELEAVKSGHYYEIPEGPYNWMERPPSVNRIIGVKWLCNLLYPEVFGYDMIKETKEFYELFYHCEITDAQVKELLGKSTYK